MRRLRLISALAVLICTAPATARAAAPLPDGWPRTFQLGLTDQPGGAADLRKRMGPGLGLRYQYLAGGANTGGGWSTWNPDGTFVSRYVDESRRAGLVPVFSYYMLRHSRPGAADQDEPRGVLRNLREPATMRAWYQDLTLALRRAGEGRGPVVLHVEPDLWGFVQQVARDDDAATVEAAVARTGLADLRGLPDDAAGVAQAVVRLRDRHAPGVTLAYHLSEWGTRVDLHLNGPSGPEIDRLARRAAAFERSLRADFDVIFTDWSDADAGFKQHVWGDGGASWWRARDLVRSARFLRTVSRGTGRRIVVWQVPLGNTRMRAMDDTWGHYRDNRVQLLLEGSAGRANLRRLARAGVIGVLFGGGQDGNTCACDAQRDGVTNPAGGPGGPRRSLNADDDGGLFRQLVRRYAAAPLRLPR